MIRAFIASDDSHFEFCDLDATPFFKDASDEEIIQLAACGWANDYAADKVTDFFADVHEGVRMMYKYLHALNEAHFMVGSDPVGTQCVVDKEDAVRWVAEHRPHLFEKISDQEYLNSVYK